MDRVFGLSRAPFAAGADDAAFWENETRVELRRGVTDRLRAGRSVWLQGPPGGGRQELLRQVARDLAGEHAPVAVVEPEQATTAAQLLGVLGAVVGGAAPPVGASLLDLAEPLYRALVDVFCELRSAVVVLPWEPLAVLAEEAAILAELRIAGRPLVAVAAAGSGPPPAAEFEVVPLTAPSAQDLQDLLAHRCAVAGRPDLLPFSVLQRLATEATGFDSALSLARSELSRMTFSAALDEPAPRPAEMATPVLDPAQVQEVEGLLAALSADAEIP